MKEIIKTEYKPGVAFSKEGEAVINLWSPTSEKAEVQLEDGLKILLNRDQFGVWNGRTNRIRPGDRYRYILNNGKALPDPASLFQPEGVHGPSEAVDLSQFPWTDMEWKNKELENYIIYELHTGCFTPQGDFLAVEGKLDYLLELGITAIEIMPVAQFPGSRNWGYDGVFPFAVQNSYGGPNGLQHLVNACHQKGIAVVLDVVYNHIGPEGNYLSAFAPYFTDKYKTPWGGAINFDDQWSDGVRNYFIQNALMWFRDFHIDALRLDAVHAIKDFSPIHILKEMKEHVNAFMKETGKKCYMIVELDLNDNRYINPTDEGGYGMDAQWIDEFHHALRITAGGEKHGYYEDFKDVEHLAKSYRDAYVYDGQWSTHRKRTFGIKASNPGKQFIVFSQNHDQVGNRMLGERTSTLVRFDMLKLLAGAVMVSPYLPMLFMGEEWAETNPFLYFVSHSDPGLVEAVRKGRKEEFAAFHTTGEAPDPFSIDSFQRSKLEWELLNGERHACLFAYYKYLIHLRKSNKVLLHADRNNLSVGYDTLGQIIILERWKGKYKLVVVMNFSKNQQQYSNPELDGGWKKILDSSETRWGGAGSLPGYDLKDGKITLQPESIIAYER